MEQGRRRDQVFQLSLTEIAFTITFILLLLLGYVLLSAVSAKRSAEQALGESGDLTEKTRALNEATARLEGQIKACGVNDPEPFVSRLAECERIDSENKRLKLQIEDLDAQVSALEEIKSILAEEGGNQGELSERVTEAVGLLGAVKGLLDGADGASSGPTGEVGATGSGTGIGTAPPDRPQQRSAADTRRAVERAIAIAKALDRSLNERGFPPLPRGGEPEAIEALVAGYRGPRDEADAEVNAAGLERDNRDLRGQIAHLRGRLEARGGRDYPPCWADESGQIEYLFAIELRPDSAVVTRAWPDIREADARALPGVDELLMAPTSLAAFPDAVRAIFEQSRSSDPECRHYVRLRSTINDAVQSDRARLMVERFFYKVESRR